MIIARAPLRITLGGGGTDIPSYYQQHGGFCIAAAIDRYVTVTVHETFVDDLIVKYSELERVSNSAELKHPIIREALMMLGMSGHGLEISSMADIPAGTGLGSSGAFTVALLKALHTYHRETISPAALAAEACHVEIDLLGELIGKQDQYIAALGGVTCLEIGRMGAVEHSPLVISAETMANLEDGLLLFYTGAIRSASAVLADQIPDATDNLHRLKAVARDTEVALQDGDMYAFANLLNEQWRLKCERSPSASTPEIDDLRMAGLWHGALGAKLVGAGGGGFLMFYAYDAPLLRHSMRIAGLPELRFNFDVRGAEVILQ